MKKIIVILLCSFIVFGCKNANQYSMKTYYLNMSSNGVTAIVTKERRINADTKEDAYNKAKQAFESEKGEIKDRNKDLLKFELYDKNNQLVVINSLEIQNIATLK